METDELGPVMQSPAIGPAAKLAYMHIWNLAGRQPGELIVRPQSLGAACGCSDRSAR